MEKVFIKDIPCHKGRTIMLCGWVYKIYPQYFVLYDVTGFIDIYMDNIPDNIYYRDVVSVQVLVKQIDNMLKTSAICIELLSKNTITGENEASLFSIKKNNMKVNDLKKVSILKKIACDYLDCNYFLELNNPAIWHSVKEYGMHEWIVKNPLNQSQQFILLQSPNILNLISTISGIERNYQFAKCYRVPEENKYERIDSIIEFTQLAITGAFIDNQMGKSIIEQLMKHLVKAISDIDIETPFKEYKADYLECLYSSDHPDLRFEKFYLPKFAHEVANDYILLMIPYQLKMEGYFKKVLQNLSINMDFLFHIDYFEEGLNDFKYKNIENANYSLLTQTLKDYDLEDLHLFTYLFIKSKDKQTSLQLATRIISAFSKRIQPENYKFYWVNDYPYLIKNNSNNHTVNDIGQNIFTKRSGEFTFAFDLVLNGFEIASGSEKANDINEFLENLKLLKLSLDQYDYFVKALKSGAPPYFSVGIGWERLVWQLIKSKTMQDIQVFPQNQYGEVSI